MPSGSAVQCATIRAQRGTSRKRPASEGRMDALWSDYIWPLAIIVAESVLLIVLLLIAVAYLLYADRKIWAAVQIRRGPNVVGPWGCCNLSPTSSSSQSRSR